MNNELQSWSDSLTKGTCFHCEEVALKNIELEKEVKALRLILQSHGEVIEMNAELEKELKDYHKGFRVINKHNIELKEENARLREALEKSE